MSDQAARKPSTTTPSVESAVPTTGVVRPIPERSQSPTSTNEARALAPAYDFLRAIANFAAPVDRAA